MIPLDEELRFAARVRRKILQAVGAIKDSESGAIWFSDPSPNWLTSKRLRLILDELEDGLLQFGASRITLHASCGAKNHEKRAQYDGYWRIMLEDGRTDADFTINGAMVLDGEIVETNIRAAVSDQFYSACACPCRPDFQESAHYVATYFLWPTRFNSRIGSLAELSLDLKEAIRRSEDHKRRSGIREILQQALIKLDRLIVDETADDVLLRRKIG